MTDERRISRATIVKIMVSVLAGLAMVLLMFPASSREILGGEFRFCYTVFGGGAPCNPRSALTAGAVTAGLLGSLFWLHARYGEKLINRLVIALIAGFFVFLLFTPMGGPDVEGARCLGVFGQSVSCSVRPALAAGGATAVLVGIGFWLHDRRRQD